ncbi:transposable element Tcb2 transposase [Trichonephila clavipes]|nr:transposable element Tcb2 transposase [Trichonephila clavipes]
MLPNNQYQVDQESRPLTKTNIWRLNHAGLYARRPAVCNPLTTAHKHARLNWSLKHQHWSVGQCDKSRFSQSSDSHQTSISLTAQRYREEVLDPYVHLFRGAFSTDFIFMDDNAPCHRAVLIDAFLETENIQRMSWPVNSPDLNPMEHVWDILGRQIEALLHSPSSLTELKRAVQEAWNSLSPQLIHPLIASTVNRCAACLSVRGDHMPY